jgi:hypothetical protein
MTSYQDSFRKSFRLEIPPCLDCERKGCGAYHDVCEDYQGYKKLMEENRAVRYKSNLQREYVKDTTFKSRANDNSPCRSRKR